MRSRLAVIGAIVLKDLREFSRDRVWMILTPLSLAFLIASYWFLPTRVDEEFTIGITPPEIAHLLEAFAAQRGDGPTGVEVVPFDDEEELERAVAWGYPLEDGDELMIGIAFPEDFVSSTWRGEPSAVSVYVDGAVPVEMRQAMTSGIREAVYALQAVASGENPLKALPVAFPDPRTMVLGEDRAGDQVPLREKLLPMLLVVILMMEAMALGGLVAIEIEQRTITALLVTPARVADVLAAKATVGALLGMGQGLIFIVATGSFGASWLPVIALMLLGSILAAAMGMMTGAAGRDFISTLFLGVLFLMPLVIPAIASLFPGSTPLWIQVLPSFGLVEAMTGTISHGQGWVEIAPAVGLQVLWVIALLVAAVLILKRRVVAL